jgi:hypothetical protein
LNDAIYVSDKCDAYRFTKEQAFNVKVLSFKEEKEIGIIKYRPDWTIEDAN